ncbi:Hypothetical protein PHPALM_8697 [Phytophthora palmivora]|uniref:Uncharacterized protein n=1 Tax=Phytophthora palmivora TaxID=4796 RepID=A0A2P4Y970_9STRA|nr:Hypothetical protein PHPALM_8697 [Phytophthora palmivora]
MKRIRRSKVSLRDYEVDLPESLVVQTMNTVVKPTLVKAVLEASNSEKKLEGVKVLTRKCVSVRKRNAQGKVERHRACITVMVVSESMDGILSSLMIELDAFADYFEVDIVTATTMENIKLVLTEIGKKFKDLGDVSHLLAMEIKCFPDGQLQGRIDATKGIRIESPLNTLHSLSVSYATRDYRLLNGCKFANKNAYQLAMTNVTCSAYSKYKVKSVDLKFHKSCDFVGRKVFRLKYCASDENINDIFHENT